MRIWRTNRMSAAGWYPDPADPRRQRYFDGRVWTQHYAPSLRRFRSLAGHRNRACPVE
ncbi:DUF2510 domain-containing protein [Skermania piniformis]|uniref:DUF2510 domain-containing protein n=1 Tax=Skermania pinensis TaxID=39122 RepID=A0ABX8SD49_9ACTN|nr:DUF2510 domain-containing protein [Skermania piniformis]